MRNISKSAFKFNENSRYIACVGINGGTTDYGIMLGFYDAAKCIQNSLPKLTEDTIVYPLVFCERHCIELGLKIIIKNILAFDCTKIRINSNVEKHIKDVLKQHDINALYKSLQNLEIVDKRLKSKIKAINYKHKLFEFYFDNASDAFRYDMPLKGNINRFVKEKIMHISLDELWSDFDGIYKNINECINFTEILYYEYALKVYTKKLSRDDLIFIAKKLPKRMNWGNKKFGNVKNTIIKRFGLSSNEFSKALHKIEEHMTLCTLVGLEKKYKHFSKDAFKIYKFCYYLNNKKKDANIILNLLSHDKIVEIKQMQDDKCDVEVMMSKLLLKSDIKLLYLFWTFGKRNDCFVEYIDYYYTKELENNYHMIVDYARKLLFDASLQDVIYGMKWTGQNTYADELERT